MSSKRKPDAFMLNEYKEQTDITKHTPITSVIISTKSHTALFCTRTKAFTKQNKRTLIFPNYIVHLLIRLEEKMKNWSHLVRFIAEEDHQIHLGQLVDTDEDVGLATFEGKPVKAKLINGTIFDGVVSEKVLTVKQVIFLILSDFFFVFYFFKKKLRFQNYPLPRERL